jgi:hypothetical protein
MIPALCRFSSYLRSHQVLDRLKPDLVHVVESAWARYMSLPDAERIAIHSLDVARASVVSAFMADAAKARFDGRRDEGIFPRERYKPAMWSFNNRVTIRFKKMDENGYSRNIQTERVRRLLGQEPMPEEMMVEDVRVDVGYQLNDLKSKIEKVLISHRNGGAVVWKYAITEGGTIILPLFPNDEGDQGSGARIIRPKRPDIGGARNEGTNDRL